MATLFFLIVVFYLYATSLRNVNPKTVAYFDQLKKELKAKGYKNRIYLVSTKRAQWHNRLLSTFGAARKSQHLHGNAIDVLVLDINDDRKSNHQDVEIVKSLLEKIIGDKGGIGTYMKESFILNRQMIHFDCRGYHARWDR